MKKMLIVFTAIAIFLSVNINVYASEVDEVIVTGEVYSEEIITNVKETNFFVEMNNEFNEKKDQMLKKRTSTKEELEKLENDYAEKLIEYDSNILKLSFYTDDYLKK